MGPGPLLWFDGSEPQLLDGPGRRSRAVYRASFDFPAWVPERD